MQAWSAASTAAISRMAPLCGMRASASASIGARPPCDAQPAAGRQAEDDGARIALLDAAEQGRVNRTGLPLPTSAAGRHVSPGSVGAASWSSARSSEPEASAAPAGAKASAAAMGSVIGRFSCSGGGRGASKTTSPTGRRSSRTCMAAFSNPAPAVSS